VNSVDVPVAHCE